jgi:hypothetical protein
LMTPSRSRNTTGWRSLFFGIRVRFTADSSLFCQLKKDSSEPEEQASISWSETQATKNLR